MRAWLTLILIVYYLCLIFILRYRFKPKIPSILPHFAALTTAALQDCQSNRDCTTKSDQVCLGGKCVSKLNSGHNCDSVTGDWILTDEGLAACQCKYPRLMSQRIPGGNCDVDAACRPHGRLVGLEEEKPRCICNTGYKSLSGTGCVQLTAIEMNRSKESCDDQEVDTFKDTFTHMFHDRYIPTGVRCVKRPCSFDALTGRPLKKARFVPGWGCVCDPRRGNIGVRLDHPEYIQTGPGYNACVNIFEGDEPLHDRPVTLYTYFYVYGKRPISFIQYTDLHSESLKHPFPRGVRNLQIQENWPYDMMQYVLSGRDGSYAVQSQYCTGNVSLVNIRFRIDMCFSETKVMGSVPLCRHIPLLVSDKYRNIKNLYFLLFEHPACKIDEEGSPYEGWIVSNPFHTQFPHHQLEGAGSNGLRLTSTSQNRNWSLDLTPKHVDFLDGVKAVPNYTDKIPLSWIREQFDSGSA